MDQFFGLKRSKCTAARPPILEMVRISRDDPFYYLTSVAHDRLPIFRSDAIKDIACRSWDEARKSGEILIFAYVIMPDHVHMITDSHRKMSDVLRFINGISAKRILDHLKSNNYESSLRKLRQETKAKGHQYSVWQHNPDAFRITGEDALWQKVNYIHQNPVRAGLVGRAEEYRYSSVRLWRGGILEDEPFITDHKQIDWRPSK
jgi:REP element-mobilizing transposase RayT